jgi:hypothetical protein
MTTLFYFLAAAALWAILVLVNVFLGRRAERRQTVFRSADQPFQ